MKAATQVQEEDAHEAQCSERTGFQGIKLQKASKFSERIGFQRKNLEED